MKRLLRKYHMLIVVIVAFLVALAMPWTTVDLKVEWPFLAIGLVLAVMYHRAYRCSRYMCYGWDTWDEWRNGIKFRICHTCGNESIVKIR